MDASLNQKSIRSVIGETSSPSHDEVLADIAHGLQTPLAALGAHIALFAKKHPRNKHIKICRILAEDMSDMVRDLVRLARTDTTVRQCVQEKIDVGLLIESIVEYLGILAQSKGITLEATSERNIYICGARKQIEEVIANLITNSIKYIDVSVPERNRIHVAVTSADAHCCIRITDTGIGIASDELPHVFSRFYRTRAGTERAPGSGLGLAIAKKTIEAHGGSIGIESEAGKGTCVSCTLPLIEPHLPGFQSIQKDSVLRMLNNVASEEVVLKRFSVL
ncbi:MAG: HAMP domain-containing histidine kinase [Candidatus Pacebacteria bacterium]|nr:HAMP domain-containing histidine kinase [Candidatus Paceibacterota bacterium]